MNEVQKDQQNKKNPQTWKRVGCIVGALAIAGVGFFAGFCARWYSIDKEMRTLIDVKNKIDSKYYEEITDEEFYGAIYDVVNHELLDSYSKYMTADEYAAANSESEGNRIGVGLVFVTSDNAGNPQLLITRVCGNSPAEKAGIVAGSYVTGFGASAETIQDSVIFDEFSSFIKQFEENESFYARIVENGEEKIVKLCRGAYVENYVFYRTNTASYTVTGSGVEDLSVHGEPLSALDDNTGYIRLLQFSGNSAKEFKGAMEKFRAEGKKNLVLDLRGNGGGDVEILREIAGYFCKNSTENKPLVAVADYGEKRENFYAKGNYYKDYFTADSRIVVLADGESASATEALMGSMLDDGAITYQDICLTEIDGVAKTFGKGIMQTTYQLHLFEKDALKLTTAQIRWPLSDTCIHGRGILASDGTKTVAKDYRGDTELITALNTLLG